jgi:hypothetical protein
VRQVGRGNCKDSVGVKWGQGRTPDTPVFIGRDMALADNQETPSTIADYNTTTERDRQAEVRQGERGRGGRERHLLPIDKREREREERGRPR